MGRKNTMKKLFILLFVFLFIFGFLFQSVSLAQVQNNNKVEAVLVIPSDWAGRITPEIEAKYKQNIQNGMIYVQQIYAKYLQGHTFVLDNNMQVLRPTGIITKTETWCGVFDLTQELSLPITPSNRTRVFFMVGSKNYSPCGLFPNAKSKYGDVIFRENPGGEVYINHQDLEGLDDPGRKQTSLTHIAHELGHAFGLDFTGWALTHTCSVLNKNECREDVPEIQNGQYPPDTEAKSIMSPNGGESFIDGGLSYGFDKSIYNPEVQKLFSNLFINPEGSSPPPIVSPIAVQGAKFNSFSSNPVKSGDILHITGSGFGEKSGKMSIYNGDLHQIISLQIISWKDSEIVVQISQLSLKYTTSWVVMLSTSSYERINISEQLTIEPISSSLAAPTPVPTFAPQEIPTPTPSPVSTPVSTLMPSPALTPTPSPINKPSSVTQMRISNYNDFRSGNTPGDSGSITQTFTNQSQNPIIWTKSTLNPNSEIYVDVLDFTGSSMGVLGFSDIKDGQLFQVPNSPFVIQAKVIRKIIKIKIGDQEITSDFTRKIRLHLPGVVGQISSFPVPILITYNDGNSKSLFFNFNYKPQGISTPTPSTTAAPTTTPSSISCRNSTPGFVPGSPHNDGLEDWGGVLYKWC